MINLIDLLIQLLKGITSLTTRGLKRLAPILYGLNLILLYNSSTKTQISLFKKKQNKKVYKHYASFCFHFIMNDSYSSLLFNKYN